VVISQGDWSIEAIFFNIVIYIIKFKVAKHVSLVTIIEIQRTEVCYLGGARYICGKTNFLGFTLHREDQGWRRHLLRVI
jgi:hypothetical protein